MLKLMVVAGDNTEKLSNYLESRGSIQVTEKHNSFSIDEDYLTNNIIRINKLIYVYNNMNMPIREDMRILYKLLVNSVYFKVEEVIIYVSEPDTNNGVGLTYFESVVRDAEEFAMVNKSVTLPQFEIQRTAEALTFERLYSSLVGISQPLDSDNQYRTVWRVERDNSSTKAYDSDDYTDDYLEPFSYRNIKEYETSKQSVARLDSGNDIIERNDNELKKADADLGQLAYSELKQPLQVMTVCSPTHAGSTTFGIAVAVSAAAGGKQVAMLDLSSNSGLSYSLETSRVPHSAWSINEVLLNSELTPASNLTVIEGFKLNQRLDLLLNVLDNLSRFKVDLLIIDLDPLLWEMASKLLADYDSHTFLLSSPYTLELESTFKFAEMVKSCNLVLTPHIKYQAQYPAIDAETIRSESQKFSKILSASIEGFDVEHELYSLIMEG